MHKEYCLHRQNFKYYVIPNTGFVGKLPYPNNFLSSYSKRKAIKIMDKLELAFSYGYMKRIVEGVSGWK